MPLRLCVHVGNHRSQVIVGQSVGLFISTWINDVFAAQSFSFVLILCLMLFGKATPLRSCSSALGSVALFRRAIWMHVALKNLVVNYSTVHACVHSLHIPTVALFGS